MSKKIVKNIFLYGIGDFIVTGVTAFLFIPLYIKYLTVQEYGIYNVLNNNLTLLTYVFQFGIISAFSRIYFLKKSKGCEKEYTWSIIYLHLLYSGLLFLIIYFFRDSIFNILSPSIKEEKLLLYPVTMAFLTFLPSLYYIFLRIEERAKTFVIYQVVNVVIISALLLVNLLFYKIDLHSVLICFIITNVLLWVIVVLKFFKSFNLSFRLDYIEETLKFSFPIFISYIAYFFISKYSIIILQNHISLAEIGLFSLAQQISAIPSLITIAITKAMQPFLFSSGSDEELKVRAQKFDSNYKLIMIWVVGSLIFSVDFLFSKFLPISYFPIHNVAKYLLLVSLVYNLSIVENSILLFYMKSKIILVITVAGSLLNVILSNILVYSLSINGILISMFIAFSVNFSLDIYFSAKHIRLNYDLKWLVPCLLIVILYLTLSSDLFSPNIPSNFLAAGLSFLVLTSLVALSLKQNKNDFIIKK